MRTFVLISLAVFLTVCAYAEENITITTYYPSPSGSYLDLNVQGTLLVGGGTPATSVNSSRIEFTNSNGSSSSQHWNIDQASSNTNTPQLRFFTEKNNNTSESEKLILNSDGKVGIGTDTPRARLDLSSSGAIRIGDESITCNNANKGVTRFHNNLLEVCKDNSSGNPAWSGVGQLKTKIVTSNPHGSTPPHTGPVSCDSANGWVLMGGGCYTPNPTWGGDPYAMYHSYPSGSNTWNCVGTAAPNGLGNLVSYAVCGRIE